MPRLKSKMPRWEDLPTEQHRYLEDLDRRSEPHPDVSSSASASDIAASFNALLAKLRTAGMMEE